MINNYLKIAIRQCRKQKLYTAIKIGGLALGIAACILIALYIKNEISYDNSYPNADRIYRVIGIYNNNGKIEKDVSFPAPMGKVLKTDFPEVELSGRLMPNSLFWGAGSNELRRSDQAQNTYEKGFTYVDQQMLDILNMPFVYGKRSIALKEPLTMVISKKKANKYFPGQNPIGKVMYLDNNKTKPYTVTGVMQDFPETSHLHTYDFLLTLTGIEFWKGEQNTWMASNYPDYVLLKPGTNIAQFEKKITQDILKNHYLPELLKGGYKDAKNLMSKYTLKLQNVRDINLYSYDIHDQLTYGDIRFIWLFGTVALFILIIACINFVNLSTAKSANRAKEVGLRKAVGSLRSSLINQFLGESIVYSFFSFVLGILLAWILLPYFNTLASKSLTIPWTAWWLVPFLVLSVFIVGITAGLYPAFYLSAFKPAQVLKGSIGHGSKSSILRNSLVVFQFTTSIILIICTCVIYTQMRYMLNKKVGFDKDQVVVIQGTNTLGTNIQLFKNELLKLSSVKSVTISDYLPIAGTKRNGNTFYNEGKTTEEVGVFGQSWMIDNDYIKTMGMKIVAGRNFSAVMPTDSQAVIINQALANKLNLKNPVGKHISNGGASWPVIGIVQDFNFESMRDKIGPMVFHLGISPSIVSVKITGGDINNTIKNITSIWNGYSPDQPLRYTFMDEQFANMYTDVQRTGHIFTTFAILAIIIACLGLFALSAFEAQQRSKEIGIRKVLGATITNITTLLSFDFIKLVFIAIVIALPIAWWAMSKWLQDFAYRTPIYWWILVLASLYSFCNH